MNKNFTSLQDWMLKKIEGLDPDLSLALLEVQRHSEWVTPDIERMFEVEQLMLFLDKEEAIIAPEWLKNKCHI